MQVVNQRNENNMGSKKVTHGTMQMKSNTKDVRETPTMMPHQTAMPGECQVTKGMMPKHNK